MKTIAIIGLALGAIGIVLALYCQLEIVPNYNYLDDKYELTSMEQDLWRGYGDQKFLIGSFALLFGGLAAIFGLISGLKKQKMGWIAFAIGLLSFFLGAAQSTHMFS